MSAAEDNDKEADIIVDATTPRHGAIANYVDDENERPTSCPICHIRWVPHHDEKNVVWCTGCGQKMLLFPVKDPDGRDWEFLD